MINGENIILVTGATGNQGGAVARALLDRGHKVRALTRKPEGPGARALESKGAQVVEGNLDDPGSIERALQGAWGVFAVQNTWEAGVEREEAQGKLLAEIAHRQGVRHFVYSSVASAQRRTGIPHFDNKWRIEEKIRALDFPSHVILRPVFFMENWLSPWFKPALDQGKVTIGIKPQTRLQQIAVEDIGKYGLAAFERHEALNRKEIDIAGDSRTMPETAQILGTAMGKDLGFVQVPIEEIRKSSPDFALMLEWFDRVGYDADIDGNAMRYDIHPTTLSRWASSVMWD